MNKYQRIILVLGAIALIASLIVTPRVGYGWAGTEKDSAPWISPWHRTDKSYPWRYPLKDVGTGILQILVVMGVTGLLFLAVKSNKKGKGS